MYMQPPDPERFGSCLKCNSLIEESEQSGGVCFECQCADFGKEPAFPIGATEYGGHGTCFGITARDYFAVKAMQGICAHSDTWGLSTNAKIATASYELADAMIAARSA